MSYLDSPNSFLMMLHLAFVPIRMPLFSFLSGWVYAIRPTQPGEFQTFAIKKVRRLLIPLAFLTTLMVALKSLSSSTRSPAHWADLPFYLTHRFEHLWYLQALFLIFLVVAIVDIAAAPRRKLAVFLLLGLSIPLFYISEPDWTVWSIAEALFIFPFFVLGVASYRHADLLLRHKTILTVVAGILLVGLFVINWKIVAAGQFDKFTLIAMLLGAASVIFLLCAFPAIAVLHRIGVYSYSIYLFHIFVAALVNRLGFSTLATLLLATFIAGIFVPILIEIVITRFFPWTGFLIGKPFQRFSWPQFRKCSTSTKVGGT